MFLRFKRRRKDGKDHRYWSVVENTRVGSGRVVQRQVLYLGEINDTQELAWRRSIAVLADGAARPRTLSLFPEDRCEGVRADASVVRVKLSELQLRRPRQWGACWLALLLWRELQLDLFWCKRLGVSRKGTRWDQVLFVLVAYRLLAPGSEWRLHREWFQRSALADLLGEDAGLAEIHKLYRCHDRLLVPLAADFRGGLQGYRRTGPRFTADLQSYSGRTIDVPSLFIGGKSDWGVYQMPGAFERMQSTACTQMRGAHLVEGAGHWVEQEQPEQVSRLLIQFLQNAA